VANSCRVLLGRIQGAFPAFGRRPTAGTGRCPSIGPRAAKSRRFRGWHTGLGDEQLTADKTNGPAEGAPVRTRERTNFPQLP